MNKILRNQRGFMLLNVIFLTLITSLAAMILFNAAPRVKNPQPTLRLIALNLADEQLAQLESLAAAGEPIGGNYSFLGREADLTCENFGAGSLIKFSVTSGVTGGGNLRKASVTVEWQIGGEKSVLTAERTIRIVQPETP